jgi:hypothetical protein
MTIPSRRLAQSGFAFLAIFFFAFLIFKAFGLCLTILKAVISISDFAA